VSEDPQEERDLASAEPRRVDAMARELGAWVGRVAAPVGVEGAETPLDAETRRGLEALGYVE
jgi:hypothetical protein